MTLTIEQTKFPIPHWDMALYRGDTRLIEVTLLTEQGAADLQGCRFKLHISPDEGEVIAPDIQVKDNVIMLYFSPTLTQDLAWQRGKYDLQMTRNGVVTTILHGKVRLKEDITR